MAAGIGWADGGLDREQRPKPLDTWHTMEEETPHGGRVAAS
nr:hypothetical protein [Streptomyces caeruleatus]